jgi:hypothetical protein
LVKKIAMAPKEKKDPAWDHCQLVGGKMVCNHCQKEISGGYPQVETTLSTCKREYKTLKEPPMN